MTLAQLLLWYSLSALNGMELDGTLISKLSLIPFYKLGFMKNLVTLEFFNFYWKGNFLCSSWFQSRDDISGDTSLILRYGFQHGVTHPMTTFSRFFNLHRRGHGFPCGVSHPISLSWLPSWYDRTHDTPVLDNFGVPF